MAALRTYFAFAPLTLVRYCRLLGILATILLVWSVPGSAYSSSKPSLCPDQRAIGAPDPNFTVSWNSRERDNSDGIAWGDYDGDGDLDLAASNYGGSGHVYRNDNGILTEEAVWSSAATYGNGAAWADVDSDGDIDLALGASLFLNSDGILSRDPIWEPQDWNYVNSIAWGDYDGDGGPDLVVGTRSGSFLYRNNKGVLSPSPVWSSGIPYTEGVAWADYDQDGDLDLATVQWSSPTRLFPNEAGKLATLPSWTAKESHAGTGLAWGDFDNDGDPDLAEVNWAGPTQIYRNDRGSFSSAPYLSFNLASLSRSVAWGDYDGDGDVDLAIGAELGDPTTLYRNEGGYMVYAWSAPAKDNTESVAWADFDGDGDLDLAVGNDKTRPNRLYRNDGGIFIAPPVEVASSTNWASAVALGDYDADGYLDLAVGSSNGANLLYRNSGGTLVSDPAWSSADRGWTKGVMWGDYEGDGDLDLAVAGFSASNSLYRNEGGVLDNSAAWHSIDFHASTRGAWGDYDSDGDLDLVLGVSQLYRNDNGHLTERSSWTGAEPRDAQQVAWGDYDGDGDLDLAVANYGSPDGEPNDLYRNDNGNLSTQAVWSSSESDRTTSLAWGDFDSDGDVDLAVGNVGQPSRVYRNDAGVLTTHAVWSSTESEDTYAVAWSDYDGDGDQDLTTGNSLAPNRVYRNDHGVLTFDAQWAANELYGDKDLAWGDLDNDGDLDLVGATGIMSYYYINHRDLLFKPALPGVNDPPLIYVARPSPPGNADGYSASKTWPASGSVVSMPYTLRQAQSRPVSSIRAYYSPNGSGKWLPAIPAPGTVTTNLAASPNGTFHTYNWDVFASGFFGQSDNVVFRIVALPDLHPVKNSVPGPFLHGSNASATTFPFRVRGTQVRVLRDNQPVKDALVFRQPAGATAAAQPITSLAGEPFTTDSQGYLQGRGALAVGDRLFALAPISATASYTLYYTSAAPTATGVDGFTVVEPGIQNLTVSPSRPLLLFNLDVSLEWDARNDLQFLTRLKYDFERAAQFIYDWTDGQATLGDLRVHHDRGHWEDADIRVYATNRLRPNATQGGIAAEPLADPANPAVIFGPGQVFMGSQWYRYGDPAGGGTSDDWARALAHELGHYAFYMEDNYLGVDPAGRLIPVDTCPGAMADPYRDDAPAGYGEFHPAANWLPACEQTLSHRTTGRADWSTLTAFYPALRAPGFDGATANPGPISLPLALTHLRFVEPSTAVTTLESPVFFMTQDGQRAQPGAGARGVLYTRDRATDLGRPTLDQLLGRGAKPGDEVCLYEPAAGRFGCAVVTLGNEQLPLVSRPAWQPEIEVSPVTSRTLNLLVRGAPPGLALGARLYPGDGSAGDPIDLREGQDAYTGVFALPKPALSGLVRVWVNEAEPRRETAVDYTLGGNPGHQRSGGGHQRSGGVPAMSADGQVILFSNNVNTSAEWYYTLQATSRVNNLPAWATLVGRAYRLAATPNAPGLQGASITFNYIGSEVPPGEEEWVAIYYFAGERWQQLETRLDRYHNLASAVAPGPGIYALMSSIEIELYAAGWNWFSYPVAVTRPITDALVSIAGNYTTVFSYEGPAALEPWRVFDTNAPAWVNDLAVLEFAHPYWINITHPLTLRFRGVTGAAKAMPPAAPAAGVPLPPAMYYGYAWPDDRFTPTGGMIVTATIGETVCGVGRTRVEGGKVVYTVKVAAAGSGAPAGCGVEGRQVRFSVDGQRMGVMARWDTSRIWRRDLSLAPWPELYLPFVSHPE